MEYCEGDAKEELVRLMVERSGEMMDWMITENGFEFGNISAFFHPKMWKVWASYQGDTYGNYVNTMEKAKATEKPT